MERNASINITRVANGFMVESLDNISYSGTLVFNELKGYSGNSLTEFLEEHFSGELNAAEEAEEKTVFD